MNILIDLNCLANQAEAIIEAADITLGPRDLCRHGFFRRYITDDQLFKIIEGRTSFWEDQSVFPWAHDLYAVCLAFGRCAVALPEEYPHTPDVNEATRWLIDTAHIKCQTLAGAIWFVAGHSALITQSLDVAGLYRQNGGRALTLDLNTTATSSYVESKVTEFLEGAF